MPHSDKNMHSHGLDSKIVLVLTWPGKKNSTEDQYTTQDLRRHESNPQIVSLNIIYGCVIIIRRLSEVNLQ